MTDLPANADGPGANGLELRVHGDFVAWLAATGGSLAATTYNSGKLALFAAPEGALVVQVVRLERPMGVAYRDGMLAVATRCRICQWFAAAPGPSGSKPAPTLFSAAASHETGRLDVHDLAFDADGLVFANTRFNCVARPSRRAKFRRHWTPPFMEPTRSLPRDCCHLNGIGVRDGRVELVTTFGLDGEPGSWRREDRWTSGAVLETRTADVAARGLCMPHSPRWDGARWWLCNSGQGTLATLDPAARQFRDVATLPGFTRGLAFAAGRAVVGLSHIRKRHVLDAPPVRARFGRLRSGLWLVSPRSGRATGALEFVRGGREVFDVAFLPQVASPRIVGPADDRGSESE